jgi:two-component system phosphate regulon sensor histidine kinase PhoR
MESGRKEFVLRPTLVEEIVSKTRAAFTPVLERRRAELDVDAPREPVFVDADRAALCDALLNLLTNALKYGGDPPSIHLKVAAGPRDVRFSVQDNGQGLAAREHSRIFEKFYRVDDRLSREREGSGLGLAIVKHVVKAHRGRIELTSAPGEGSTFTIVISRRPEPGESTEPSASRDE